MATLSNYNLTLLDWAKRVDPEGRVPAIAELLTQTNEIQLDAVHKEGNTSTGERVVIRTGLPTVYWRALNQGIPSSKSTTAQVDEACGILEARSEIDKDLAMLNGNTDQFRLSEDFAFLEAMNQTQAETLFYGNPAEEPKEFLGLSTRYSAISGADNAQNVITAGGSDDTSNTSIYLVGWGEQTVYCPFPKGSKAGLTHENLGEQTVYNGDNRLQALVSRYQWKTGLVVKDWRYVVRICNIDTDALAALSGTQAVTAATSILRLLAKATSRIPSFSLCRPAFYMNRTVYEGLRIAAMEKASSSLAIQQGLDQFGRPVSWTTFDGLPLRKCDAIINTEDVVS